MISVSTIGFSGMPDLVLWSEIILDIALRVKSKMAAIWPRSNIKLISFPMNRNRCMILVSTIRFSGMPDLVVLSKITLDVAL